ncbi:MAG: hypothetical protein NDJ89_07675 [Oligoflexia bacterium]|nr:hypothetical protein [Oligoflexia bacterium]
MPPPQRASPFPLLQIAGILLFIPLLQGCTFSFLRQTASVAPLMTSVTVAPRYPSAPDWNQYVDRTAPETLCPADSGTSYFSCLHGGEKKRVNLSGASSCAGYAIRDELGAFDWACDDRGGPGAVFFYTRGLKQDKGLVELLEESSWKENRVVILQGGIPIAESARARWWSNPVLPLPANTVAGTFVTLASPGTIYTVATPTSASGGFEFAADGAGDRIAIVTLPGAALTLTGSTPKCGGLVNETNCLIELKNSKHFWIEGELRGSGSGFGVAGRDAHHGTIRGVGAIGFFSGIGSQGRLYSSFFSRIRASNNDMGIYVSSTHNRLRDILVTNSLTGITSNMNNNFLQNISAVLNSVGLDIGQSSYSAATALTISPNGKINLTSGSGNTFHNFQSRTLSFLSTVQTTISQGAADNIELANTSYNKLTANWVSTAPACSITLGTDPGLDASCANQGASDAVLTVGSGNFAPYTLLTADDAANGSDALGVATFESITDWLNFENPWRAWGSSDGFSRCQAGSSCQIWDFRPSPLDTRVRNTTGNGASLNPDFSDGDLCPPLLDGNVVSVDLSNPPRTFLRNAVELIGWDDGAGGGNHNGLCESGETCLYTPNFGSYQGQGDFTAKRCVFKDGIVSGVTIYAYPEP